MNQEELQVAAFEIILHSGSARTTVHEAFADMREGHYDEAAEKLEAAMQSYWKRIMHKQICCKNMRVVLKLKLKSLWCMLRII